MVNKGKVILSSEKKYEKRKTIAKSTCDLFIEKGYVNITISEIAKVAGIGKGTIYEYFENKEDIVFELMACLQESYDNTLYKKLEKSSLIQEKVIFLFDIFLSDNPTVKVQRKIYKEFLSIYIHNKTDSMKLYNEKMMDKYKNILEDIFKKSIEEKKLSKISLEFIPSIFATLQGFFIMEENKNVMLDYLNNLFKVLEIKETL